MFYSRGDLQAMLAILYRTVTQTCWLPLLQNKTEEYIGNDVKKYNTVISILMQALNVNDHGFSPSLIKIEWYRIGEGGQYLVEVR
jgi:hypothetical protein